MSVAPRTKLCPHAPCRPIGLHAGLSRQGPSTIASPGSARNIRENPKACVAFINIFTQKGYQITGPAACLNRDHPGYPAAESILLAITQGHYPFSSIFRVSPEQVRPIIAPRYKLFPDTTEEQQIDSAMRTYGVRPRQPDPGD